MKNDNTTQGVTKLADNQKNITTQASNLSEEDVAILSILKEFPQSSLKYIASALRWRKDKVAYCVKKLKAKGFVERVGTSQKGFWKVLT